MNKYDYKNISPFKWFVLENFPFIEDDFDALTNWQLFCKIGKEINRIIASQNEVGQAVEEFTEKFIALNNYVHDYFDNLDVQEEINNKLDTMASDGTLSNLMEIYLDPYLTSFENSINNLENTISAVASGSPKGTYSTLADLISDDPDHNYIYVVSENGYWYYYNNNTSSWTSGGVYQATALADGSVTPYITNFLKPTDDNLWYPPTTLVDGIKIDYDPETFLTSIKGTSNRNSATRRLVFKCYLEAGTWSLRQFDNTGNRPPIYMYTEENYNESNWNDNLSVLAASAYATNINVEVSGYIYFVAYYTYNQTFAYTGKMILCKKPYNQVTNFVPILFNFADFIKQNNVYINDPYWKNKNIVCYGDSLTAWGTWRNDLAEKYQANVINCGLVGSHASSYTNTNRDGCSPERISSLPENADIVIIMFGTNDYSHSVEIGSVPESFTSNMSFDTLTFAGGLLSIIQQLYNKYPNARFILMCPPWNHYPVVNHKTLIDFGTAIKQIGEITSIPVIDLFKDLNINYINQAEYYSDGIHLNNNGYQRISQLLCKMIDTMTPTQYNHITN